jgi:2-aminoadipate transaminase
MADLADPIWYAMAGMDLQPSLRHDSATPLYRQLYDEIAGRIRSGALGHGERLPATRELAGLLGLNRATIAAAYELLETEGLISGHVGRGSFVTGQPAATASGVEWSAILEGSDLPPAFPSTAAAADLISFATSRPARDLFPLDDFRASCAAVMARGDLAGILQLGSPSGYEPLRHYLVEEARRHELAGPDDDLIVTNGCQQALDLVGRVLLRPGDSVAVEDPVYSGIKNQLAATGARLVGIPMGADGLDVPQLARTLQRERVRFLVVTPNFQNPTGLTLPLPARQELLEAARAAGVPVIENDAYGELRYHGEPLPAVKQLDNSGGTVLLRSFSKVSFPGLRVGWVLGPKAFISRLRRAKETSDLHTDQLSQAVLLEFAVSGRLKAHRARVLAAGAERLAATLAGCQALPAGSRWTRPEGGMNVWVRLPEPVDTADLLPRARKEGIDYLPGRYCAVSRPEHSALRLSFAVPSPERIREGLAVLGRLAAADMELAAREGDPVPAMV